MASIILSNIPDICTREDLVNNVVLAQSTVDYILHPLGKDITRALVTFKSQKVAESVLHHKLIVFGVTLKSRPAPRQTYQRCTANVDPMIMASIPDLQECITQLQYEFGVDVSFAHGDGTMILAGSLLQIQCAQTKLDNIFRQQQEEAARELLMVEQDLTTPRSHRSLSVESNNVERREATQSAGRESRNHTSKRHRNEAAAEARRTQSAREARHLGAGDGLLNAKPGVDKHTAGRLYNHRPQSATPTPSVRHSADFSPSASKSKSGSSSRTSKKDSSQSLIQGLSADSARSLQQGLSTDDSFVITGVKILRHSTSEESGRSQKESSGDFSSSGPAKGHNTFSHTAPVLAWGEDNNTTTSQPQQQPRINKTTAFTSNSRPPVSKVTCGGLSATEPRIPAAKEGFKVSRDGKEWLSLTLELDSDVMGYIKKIHKAEVKDIEQKYRVNFSNRWSDEVMELRISTEYVAGDDEGCGRRLQEAKDALVAFYQTVYYSVVKEVVRYHADQTPEAEVDAVTTAVGKAFASRVFVNSRVRGEILLVGSWEYLPLVREWVTKKLAHKDEAVTQKSRKSKGTQKGKVSQTLSNSGDLGKTNKHQHLKLGQSTWVRPDKKPRKRNDHQRSRPIKATVAGQVRASVPPVATSVEESMNLTGGNDTSQGFKYEHKISDDLKVLIYGADITMATTDVIVNASNESLQHIGTVAAAISDAAGTEMQQQCTAYVNKYGPLKVSEVMCTPGSGALQCKQIIHAVGPMWCLYVNKEKCAEALKQTFLNTLFYANNKLKAHSLTIPAISTGVYGVPLDVCTRAMYEAIHSFSRATSSLAEIHVVDLEAEAAGMMSVIFQQLAEVDARSLGSTPTTDCLQYGGDAELDREDEHTMRSSGELMVEPRDEVEVERGEYDTLLERVSEQYASAPPVLGTQDSEDWPQTPPQSPPGRGDEEGPVSPPPSPDDDYEEPVDTLIEAVQYRQEESGLRHEHQGAATPEGILTPRAEAAFLGKRDGTDGSQRIKSPLQPVDYQPQESVPLRRIISSQSIDSPRGVLSSRSDSGASHQSEEVIQTTVPSTRVQPPSVTSADSLPPLYSPRPTDSPSPPPESQYSHRSEVIMRTEVAAVETAPINFPRTPRDDDMRSARSSKLTSTTSTPRDGQSSRAGSVKSVQLVTPTKSQQVESTALRSGEVTPKSDRQPLPGASPMSTSNSKKNKHKKSVSEMFKSPITSPRQDGDVSPQSMTRQTPRIDDLFESSGRSAAPKTADILSSVDSDVLVRPEGTNEPENLGQSDLIVAQSTASVEAVPKLDQPGSTQSPALQESLEETEATLLKQVLLETGDSVVPDATYRPRRKSPESSFSEAFDENEMRKSPLLIQMIASCICIVEKAGEIIRSVMATGELGVVKKGVNDLQTEADRSAERCIKASINHRFPEVRVIGEEGGDSRYDDVEAESIETSLSVEALQYAREVPDDLRNVSPDDIVVWVDPLDGTSEYTEGLLDHVTTLIGISVKGKAVAGIISQPYFNYQQTEGTTGSGRLGRTIWGITGMGVFGLETVPPPADQNIVCTTRSHSNQNVNQAVDSCDPSLVLRVGGSGHKVLLLLEGHSHVYVFASPGTKKWDTCGPEAVLHAAGGKLTDMHGNYYQYDLQAPVKNMGGVLATAHDEAHERYRARIPQPVLDSMHTDGPPVWQLADQLTDRLRHVGAPLVARLVAACVSAAEKAGDIVRQVMKQGELGIVEKGLNDLQTEADRSAQRCILSSLRRQFPGLCLIGEEEEDDGNHDDGPLEMTQSAAVLEFADRLPGELRQAELEDVVVWVDPLDGTAEYTQGLLDHVTVLIGIAVKGRALAGVIYQPFYNYEAGPDATLGRTIWGIVGLGAFGFEPKQPPQGQNIVCTTRSHGNRNVTLSIDACEPSEVLRVGGSGHKVLLLLEGHSHAYVFATPGTKKWDTCGPEAVLRAVGGHMTDMLGNDFQYGSDARVKNLAGVLATPPGVSHVLYQEKIPSQVRSSLVSEGPAPWQVARGNKESGKSSDQEGDTPGY